MEDTALTAAFEATNDQLTRVVRDLAAFREETQREWRRARLKQYLYQLALLLATRHEVFNWIDFKLVGLETLRLHAACVKVYNEHAMLWTNIDFLDQTKSWLGSLRDKVEIFHPNAPIRLTFAMVIPTELIEIPNAPVSLPDYTRIA